METPAVPTAPNGVAAAPPSAAPPSAAPDAAAPPSAAPPSAAPPSAAPLGKYGRPRKYNEPTDGSPLTPKMQAVLRERERKRLAYQANPEHFRTAVKRNFKARMEKQKEALKEFEELKRTLAALAAQVAA